MTEKERREEEMAQDEYRTAWIKASYEVAGWWQQPQLDEPIDWKKLLEKEKLKCPNL